MVRSITTHVISGDISAADYPHTVEIQNPNGDYFSLWCSEWKTDLFNTGSTKVPVIYAANRLGGDSVKVECTGGSSPVIKVTLNYPISGEFILVGYDSTENFAQEIYDKVNGMNVVASGTVDLSAETISSLASAIAAALPST